MRTGRTAGGSNPADYFANTDNLADFHADLGQMGIAGCEPVAMADLDHIAVAACSACNGHLAGRGCSYRFAKVATHVDARMDRETAQQRVHSPAELRSHFYFTDYRFAHRDGDQRPAVTVDLRASHIDAIKLTLEVVSGLLDRNKPRCSFGRCAAGVNSKVGQHTVHLTGSRVDMILDFSKRRGLLLLDLVER